MHTRLFQLIPFNSTTATALLKKKQKRMPFESTAICEYVIREYVTSAKAGAQSLPSFSRKWGTRKIFFILCNKVDDRVWGGDVPASFTWRGYKYDLPLLSSPRIVDVNEIDAVFEIFEVWDTEFDLHFDKDTYRGINFKELYILSKRGDKKALNLLLGSFSLEWIAYLMNNDVRFNDGYDNPIPKFDKYNRFVVRIVSHVYRAWNTSRTYPYFLRRFYTYLHKYPILGSSTEKLLEDFDANKCCTQHWFEGNTQRLRSISSMDADNGWINPFDWFGFHEQHIIDRETITQSVIKKIHILHNSKDRMIQELKWGRSKVDWGSVATFAVLAAIAVGAVFGPEVVAGINSFVSKSSVVASLKTKGLITVTTKGGGGVIVAMNPGVVIGVTGLCLTAAIFAVQECTDKQDELLEEIEQAKERDRQAEERDRQAKERQKQILENQRKHEQMHHQQRR